ncbi:hypothetical protein GCM10022235_62880 [Kribbella ginsengisoli]|uniref:Sporadically distributed protein, TIGR04141 family n=1 Tax=Kribbella ginsengisoli TaxID=363865 RepID=A0ABP6YHD2_9ACTN
MDKKANVALWKIQLTQGGTAQTTLDDLLESYNRLRRAEPANHPRLVQVTLAQAVGGVSLELYTRSRRSPGFAPFVADHLVSEDDRKKFAYNVIDACLFIVTKPSLFAVTSGFGYRVFDGYVDYAFPFEVAKRLVANNFVAADVREFSGPRASRTETYRRAQSISGSESFGKVWKRLVGRLDTGLLPAGGYLASIIDLNKPPALEMKSSFTIRKRLDLLEVVKLAQELDDLPEPSADQTRQLAFLDNLYVVRDQQLILDLRYQLLDDVRRAIVDGAELDLDLGDPDELAAYQTGTDFQLSRWTVPGDPPDKDDLFKVIRQQLGSLLKKPAAFVEKLETLRFSYRRQSDDAQPIRKEVHKFMHGQVDLNGQTYFLLDGVWYRAQGACLENLKRDFLAEVFADRDPILSREDLGLMTWSGTDEDGYNRAQGGAGPFYYGDKVFALTDRGKVELFDLLRVDKAAGVLHVIHVKDGFDGKMRDACSQISLAREVITADLTNGKVLLRAFYPRWQAANAGRGISEEEFLGWFDLNIIYAVLASTKTDFTEQSFDQQLRSHIARREIIATRNEFKSSGAVFRLLHTRRS